jgi:uncharacterized protein YbbK (DUF523 family)
MPDQTYLQSLRIPSPENPLRILISACLAGTLCGYDGTANGSYPSVNKLLKCKTAQLFRFCPEELSFGTPREMCDIHGGTGLDVLNGKARVLTESGKDWTKGMIQAAEKMLDFALKNKVELAVMMDISAACGSQVIYDGNRFDRDKKYQIGMGVAAAHLDRNGIKIISQRDFASLEILFSKLDANYQINPEAKDHHEIRWYKEYFKDLSN